MYNVEENFSRYMRSIGSDILFSPSPGKTIKQVRKSIEVSQEGMARFLGVRRETLSRIEIGTINPTSSIIKSFSKNAAIIKVFRDLTALKDATQIGEEVHFSSTFIRTHFSLSTSELSDLMRLGDTSYNKTKKKVLRRTRI